jgi:hypothetical protein
MARSIVVNGSQREKPLNYLFTILRRIPMPAKKKATSKKRASAKKNDASLNK